MSPRVRRASPYHILAVRTWQTTRTIAPILWDGLVRLMKQIPVLGVAVRMSSALLRKLNPPRMG